MKNEKIKSLKSLLLVLMLALTWACDSGDDSGPVEPETKGPISGEVNLYNSQGVPTAYEDMTVTIVGTSMNTKTNNRGKFNFSSVDFGEYQLEFKKEGFGTFYKTVEHNKGFSVNGTVLTTLSLGRISNTAIYDAIPSQENGDIKVRVTTIPVGTSTDPVYVTFFFDSEVTVSNTENEGIKGPIAFFSGQGTNEVTITASELASMGFTSGETVYFRVYGDSFHTNAYVGAAGTVHPNAKTPGSSTMSVVLP
ncbi:MAG: carboxypeptidase-like regulatory domain-containing protein [Bacteroidota bacterium]|nr:carboxypeptidase-like regulatory domain-containing protein [Bacteroidota bacterium]